jgi:hypothetical protein
MNSKISRVKTLKSLRKQNNFEFFMTVPKSPTHGGFIVKKNHECIVPVELFHIERGFNSRAEIHEREME